MHVTVFTHHLLRLQASDINKSIIIIQSLSRLFGWAIKGSRSLGLDCPLVLQLYLVVQIVPSLAFGSFFSWLLCPFDILQCHALVPSALSATKRHSRFTVYIPAAVFWLATCPWGPGPYSWRKVSETGIWALGMLITAGALWLWGSWPTEQGNALSFTCLHHSITQHHSFTALRSIRLHLFNHIPRQCRSFYHLHSCAFPKCHIIEIQCVAFSGCLL